MTKSLTLEERNDDGSPTGYQLLLEVHPDGTASVTMRTNHSHGYMTLELQEAEVKALKRFFQKPVREASMLDARPGSWVDDEYDDPNDAPRPQ